MDGLEAYERLASAGHSGDKNEMARFCPGRLVDDLPDSFDGRLCRGPSAVDSSKLTIEEQLSSRFH